MVFYFCSSSAVCRSLSCFKIVIWFFRAIFSSLSCVTYLLLFGMDGTDLDIWEFSFFIYSVILSISPYNVLRSMSLALFSFSKVAIYTFNNLYSFDSSSILKIYFQIIIISRRLSFFTHFFKKIINNWLFFEILLWKKYKHHSNNILWSLRYAIFFFTYYRMIPHPLQVPLSTPSCWESRPTFRGKAIGFFFFTLLSLSCSSSSLSKDFFLDLSLLPSVLFVLEVKSLDLIFELEPSLWGDSLKVPRFIRSD